MAEGARLLSECGPKAHRGFESLTLRHTNFNFITVHNEKIKLNVSLTEMANICKICHLSAPVAQLDRVSGYEPEGREFESLRARHFFITHIYQTK